MATQELLDSIEEIFEKQLKVDEVQIIENLHFKKEEYGPFCADVKKIVEKCTLLINEKLMNEGDSSFPDFLVRSWNDHCSCLKTLNGVVLKYIDPSDEPSQKEDFHYFGVHEFQRVIFGDEDGLSPCSSRLRGIILDIVKNERLGEVASERRDQLRDVIRMIIDVSVQLLKGMEFFTKYFENFFLFESRKFYNTEVTRFFENQENDVMSTYAAKVKFYLNQEVERSQECFTPETTAKLERLVKEEMILEVSKKYFFPEQSDEENKEEEEDGEGINETHSCLLMVENWDRTGKANLCHALTVLSLVEGGLLPLKDLLSTYLTIEGKNITDAEENDRKLAHETIEKLVRLRKKFIVVEEEEQELSPLKKISDICKTSFADVVNSYENIGENMALFIHHHIRHAIGEAEADIAFEDFLRLFKDIHDKDVVEGYLKRFLAQRFLNYPQPNLDREKAFIMKLKTEYGDYFTNKMEGMWKDCENNKKLSTQFKEYCQQTNFKNEFGFTMEAKVLTTSYWPSLKFENVPSIPKKLEEGLGKYVRWYDQGREGRYLRWIWSLGEVDVTPNGYARKYRIRCSMYQALILNLFNQLRRELAQQRDRQQLQQQPQVLEEEEEEEDNVRKRLENVENPSISFEEIKRRTGLDGKTLSRHLQGLCTGRRVLMKLERGPVRAKTRFAPNEKFRSPTIRLSVWKWDTAERMKKKKIDTKLMEERQWMIDAAIVRIMKYRKHLEHRHLLLEVVQQVRARFSPTTSMIKKRIDRLIEREYLERDPNDRKIYIYLA